MLRLNFVDANPCPELVGESQLSSYSNYFLSSDSSKWRSRVPHYGRVIAREVWPGVDVEFRPCAEGVETVFRVQPGADGSRIILEYEGLEAPLRVDGGGNLVLSTSLADLHEKSPFAFQVEGRLQKSVPVRFRLLSESRYGFTCEGADPHRELVIDPLVYSTFFGGGDSDACRAITADSAGNKIIAGWTDSPDFPVTPGAFQDHFVQYTDGFLVKFTPNMDSLVFGTYFGGEGGERVSKVLVDATGDLWVAGYMGWASRMQFPLTPDAFDTVCERGVEGYLLRFSPDGTNVEFGSFLGGDNYDYLTNVELGPDGRLYIVGYTASEDFPVTPDALFPERLSLVDAYLTIFNPIARQLDYSTRFGGNSEDVIHTLAVLALDNIWLAGSTWSSDLPVTPGACQPVWGGHQDGFIARLDLVAGSQGALTYVSYLGGRENDGAIALHAGSDQLIVVGNTYSTNFPVTPGAFDTVLSWEWGTPGFVSIFSENGMLVHSTYLGPDSGSTILWDVTQEEDGTILVAGQSNFRYFPVTPDAFDPTYNGPVPGPDGDSIFWSDAVVCRLSGDLSQVLYGTYYGGLFSDRCLDFLYLGAEAIWIVGDTESGSSTGFPTTPDAYCRVRRGMEDGFIACFSLPVSSSAPFPSPVVPADLTLSTYPNPFNSTTVFRFTLPVSSPVALIVYNLLGQRVRELDWGRLSAGEHQYLFDASDLPSGVYFAGLSAAGMTKTRKLVVLR